MKKNIRPIYLCIVLSVMGWHKAIYANDLYKTLKLNGASSYAELNTPVYLAGLYLTNKSDNTDKVFSDKNEKLIRIVVLKSSWRPQSWRRYWSNSIAVNNGGNAENSDTYKSLGVFAALAKEKLHERDEIVVHYKDNKTSIHLNDSLVVSAEGMELFSYILRVWLGDVPPSSGFKSSILGVGDVDEYKELQLKLATSEPELTRVNIYQEWISISERQEDQERERTLVLAKLKKEALEKEIAEAKMIKQRLAILENSAQEKMEKSRAEDNKKVLDAKSSSDKEQSAEKDRQLRLQLKSQLEEKQKGMEKQFIYSLINWQIQRYINIHVEYPLWAKRFEEHGEVGLNFTIDKEGRVTFLGDDEFESTLVKEVKRQVLNSLNNIAWYPSSQSAEEASKLNYYVHYVFSLDNTPQESLPKPIVPAHLYEATTSEEVGDKLKELYLTYALERINSQIIYPESAKVQRQRAKLAVNFSLNRWGEVESVSIEKPSRHDALNRALVDAVRQAAPFKPFPLPIFGLELISGRIEHSFR